MNDRKRYALLIDSDNISAKYIDAIIGEISTKYGDLSIKRIYGDWTSSQNSAWRNVLLTYSLKPVQQFRNTVGKNATDSTMIIDAMDILYSGNVDGFCIVSSDSDFTSLAQRLGEAGMMVIGMGEEKTPPSFRNACRQFVELDNLVDSDSDHDEEENRNGSAHRGKDSGTSDSNSSTRLTRKMVENAIKELVRSNDSQGVETPLSEIGNALNSRYPDFDVRAFGYSQLSRFVKSFDSFKLVKDGTMVTVELAGVDLDNVRERVEQVVREYGDDGCPMSYIGQVVKDEFPDFSLKDAGYSKLKSFLRDIPGIVVAKSADGNDYYVYPQEGKRR